MKVSYYPIDEQGNKRGYTFGVELRAENEMEATVIEEVGKSLQEIGRTLHGPVRSVTSGTAKLLQAVRRSIPRAGRHPRAAASMLELTAYLDKNPNRQTPADDAIRIMHTQLYEKLVEEAVGETLVRRNSSVSLPQLEELKNESLQSGAEEERTSPHKLTRHGSSFHKVPKRASPPREVLEIGEKKFVDPAVRTHDVESETRLLALKQTIAARECLYEPSEALGKELKTAAEGLMAYIKFLESQPDGDALLIGFSSRILGREGLFTQDWFIKGSKHKNWDNVYGQAAGAVETKGENSVQKELATKCRSVLTNLLVEVAKPSRRNDPALGHMRAVTIAIMGDVGAFMTATGATTGTERPGWVSAGLKKTFGDFALGLEGLNPQLPENQQLLNDSIARTRLWSGGEMIGPSKSQDRKRLDIDKEDYIARTGAHDTGEDADEILGRLGQPGQIQRSEWASARLLEDRVSNREEPQAGGMSASPGEILWTWDILAQRGVKAAYAGALPKSPDSPADSAPVCPDSPPSFARSAGAGALLNGCGYHPAVETIHGISAYQGHRVDAMIREHAQTRDVPADAGALFYDGAATAMSIEMYHDATSAKGQAKLPPPSQGEHSPTFDH